MFHLLFFNQQLLILYGNDYQLLQLIELYIIKLLYQRQPQCLLSNRYKLGMVDRKLEPHSCPPKSHHEVLCGIMIILLHLN